MINRGLPNQSNPASKLRYPEMVPLKLLLKLNPIQLALYYNPSKTNPKKKLYVIDLQSLLIMGDAQDITHAIYDQHKEFFDEKLVPFSQIFNIIDKILDIINNELMKEEGHDLEDDENQNDL